MSQERLLLGVDIGTQSSKGVLVTTDGRVVEVAQRPHGLEQPGPGRFEQDAEEVWWDDFVHLCRELLSRDGVDAGAIAGVGVSGIGPCVVPTDAAGTPLRPAILYGVDTRAVDQADWLNEHYGEEAVLAMGRSPLTSQAVGPKLLWLRRQEPEVWNRTERFFMASSYLVFRLTGEYVLDHHSASGVNPFYDASRRAWNDQWVSEVLGGLELPRLRWASEQSGTVHRQAAEQTGLPGGTPVNAGTVDAAAEAVSVGVRQPGDLMLMYGSTMFLIQTVRELPLRTPFWGTSFVFPDEVAVAAGMATSGILARWFRDLLGDQAPSYEQLSEDARAVPPGSDGLVVLPYFAGERTPVHDPNARGVIAGLSLAHGRPELYRAILESTAFGVRHNVETMAEHGMPPQRVVAVGGGTQGDLWPQIVSDVLGMAQAIPRHAIGAAYGDTMLAGLAAEAIGGAVHRWNEPVREISPTAEHAGTYDALYRVYRDLYERTRDQVHALAALQADTPAPA